MNILHITHSDTGGAGIAAVRLHEALLENGEDSKLLTFHKYTNGIAEHYLYDEKEASRFPLMVSVKSKLDGILRRLNLGADYYGRFIRRHIAGKAVDHQMINFTISRNHLENHPLVKDADIIHLHWASGGVMDFGRFFSRLSKKVVWTLHDMNPFTGGCHYAYDCLEYTQDCQSCPQLDGARNPSVTRHQLAKKIAAMRCFKGELSIVTPSEWLMTCSQKSTLFNGLRHRSIYNVVDGSECYLEDKRACRQKHSIPQDKKVMLCIASPSDPRKGGDVLLDAFDLMAHKDVLLCIVGGVFEELREHPSILQFGYVRDKAIKREIYNAVDVFVLPTMADNFPNTVVESLRCGTPVVSFAIGGISEQITQCNGVLVETRDAQSLAKGLDHFFDTQSSYDPDSIAEESARKYAVNKVVSQHVDLYEDLACDSSKS